MSTTIENTENIAPSPLPLPTPNVQHSIPAPPPMVLITGHPTAHTTGFGIQCVQYAMIIDRIYRANGIEPRIVFWICNRQSYSQVHSPNKWWTPISIPAMLHNLRSDLKVANNGVDPLRSKTYKDNVVMFQSGHLACNPTVRSFLLQRCEVILGPSDGDHLTVHEVDEVIERTGANVFIHYREIQLMQRMQFDASLVPLMKNSSSPPLARPPMTRGAGTCKRILLYPSHTLAHDRSMHQHLIMTLFDSVVFLTPFAHSVFCQSVALSLLDLKINGCGEAVRSDPVESARLADAIAGMENYVQRPGVMAIAPHIVQFSLGDLFFRYPGNDNMRKINARPHIAREHLRCRITSSTVRGASYTAYEDEMLQQKHEQVWVMINMGNYEVTNRKGFDTMAIVLFLLYDIWSRILQLDDLAPMQFLARSMTDSGTVDAGGGEMNKRCVDWSTFMTKHLLFCPQMYAEAEAIAGTLSAFVRSKAPRLRDMMQHKQRRESAHAPAPTRSPHQWFEYIRATEGTERFATDKDPAVQLQRIARTMRVGDRLMRVETDVTKRDMRDMYCASDVLLHTSRMEGFGVPIVEAQVCGCPVVAPGDYNPELVFLGRTTNRTGGFVLNRGMSELWSFPDMHELVSNTLKMCIERLCKHSERRGGSVLDHLYGNHGLDRTFTNPRIWKGAEGTTANMLQPESAGFHKMWQLNHDACLSDIDTFHAVRRTFGSNSRLIERGVVSMLSDIGV